MLSQREMVAIINALAGANRRGLVLYGTPPDRAEAYNMALVDVLISLDEGDAANNLQAKLSNQLGAKSIP